jgi:hypothetical protein
MTNHAADGDGWKRFNIDRKATRFVEEALARITDEQISDRHGRAEARSASSR